jgi:hypothetical protein
LQELQFERAKVDDFSHGVLLPSVDAADDMKPAPRSNAKILEFVR